MPRHAPHARNEAFWNAYAERYDAEEGPINLENGYFARMTRTVLEEYQRQIAFINRSNSVYVRQHFEHGTSLQIRQQLADLLGLDSDTLALTRSASEGLLSLIRNYNRLQPGDQVLICDLDYPSVQGAMRWLAGQRGVELIEIALPHPASHDALIDSYRQAFLRYPRLKLMVLTHVTHRTGLVLPVRDIAHVAKAHGIDVVLDGAHALGLVEFDLEDLGVAFAGYNLQKWIGGPLSLGFIYIAAGRLGDIDPDMQAPQVNAADIRSRVPYGTPNIAAWMTLPLVFEEYRSLGGAAVKGPRLSYLRDLWVAPVRQLKNIEVLTPDDPRLYCTITALRFRNRVDQQPMVDRLLADYGLFTVAREGSACGPCIRVTPSLSTREAHIQRLVRALTELDALDQGL